MRKGYAKQINILSIFFILVLSILSLSNTACLSHSIEPLDNTSNKMDFNMMGGYNGTIVLHHGELDGLSDLPSYFSWRDMDGIDYTTSIKNALPCFSCEIYATIPAVETLVQYEVGYPFGCDLSEAHLLFYSGGVWDYSVNISDALDYLVEYGVPDEGCFPDPHRRENQPLDSLPGWENRTVKIQEWGFVENDEIEIKKALIEHGPLVMIINVYKDLLYHRGGIYRHRWGKLAGGHCVTIVGYDDSQQCWFVENHWGTDWGESGWFRMAYDPDIVMPYYGGTGIYYIDGVYGNLMPDAPRVYIDEPKESCYYILGREFPSRLFKLIKLYYLFPKYYAGEALPIVIGTTMVKVNAINANKIEFYLDEELQFTDENRPFEWELDATIGRHTLEVMAYNDNGNASKAIKDFFSI